ncbi:MAG: hypothetical protein LBI03_08550, partial [Clostridiales bacterium]|nr:hypothetical protein [Clostridiales bacterium]
VVSGELNTCITNIDTIVDNYQSRIETTAQTAKVKNNNNNLIASVKKHPIIWGTIISVIIIIILFFVFIGKIHDFFWKLSGRKNEKRNFSYYLAALSDHVKVKEAAQKGVDKWGSDSLAKNFLTAKDKKNIDEIIISKYGDLKRKKYKYPVYFLPKDENSYEDLSESLIDDALSLRWLIYKYANPDCNTSTFDKIFDLLYKTYKPKELKPEDISLTGWAMAAFGRCVALCVEPGSIEMGFTQLKAAFDEYNEAVNDFNMMQSGNGENTTISNAMRVEAYNKIVNGPLPFVKAQGGPAWFAFLINTLNDTGKDVQNFVRQGCIMGLLNFLSENKSNETIKPYYESLIKKRAELISSDNSMSFFEVRVPCICKKEEYAAILTLILKAANPTITYCDTNKLMDIAVDEIPGVLDLLIQYPLRIIDPGNVELEGFYQFAPFGHRLITHFTGVKPTGNVIERYHEIMDMTIPNSSGLNLRLFTDVYSVIPVLFHEYSHFRGDHNEASVFLKTHIFATKFYKTHKAAKPSRDAIFTTLTNLFGKKPEVKSTNSLNQLIRRYYGEELTEEQAKKNANMEIQARNMGITKQFNETETWCPNIKYPLFTDDEDRVHRNQLLEILVRYGMTKKSLTKEEFAYCLSHYMPMQKKT